MLKFYVCFFLHDGQGADRQGILFADRSYYYQVIRAPDKKE